MRKRQLSSSFLKMLLEGNYRPVLKMIKEDDTIDMEMRGDSVIIYYRGGKLLNCMKTAHLSRWIINTEQPKAC